MSQERRLKIRIIDHRQSREPNYFRMISVWAILPGCLFWPGVIAESVPMQWAGFIVFLLLTCSVFLRVSGDYRTIGEAREYLDSLEADQREKTKH